jgi:aspartokinase
MGACRPPDGGRAQRHERRDQPPAGLAKELAPSKTTDAYSRELDMLAATGEQASSALLAIALQAEGMESVSYAGWQVPIKTNSAYTKARIESIDDKRVRADLAAGKVVIVTGFQGWTSGQHHHAGPRWQRHLGRGRGGRHEGPSA